jgi:hypothetical protein
MLIPPFMTHRVRSKKDALSARLKARLVASLLQFEVHEQACIAAGTFLIACQTLANQGKCVLCFQIDQGHLHVYAREHRTADLPLRKDGAKQGLHLDKFLPCGRTWGEKDVAWLVKQVEESAHDGLFNEIMRQNQEILALLHELQIQRANLAITEGTTRNPNAA